MSEINSGYSFLRKQCKDWKIGLYGESGIPGCIQEDMKIREYREYWTNKITRGNKRVNENLEGQGNGENNGHIENGAN